MNSIQRECDTREITRICHFTQSRNLAHIFDDPIGLCSTRRLKRLEMPYNPTDRGRYDGRDDLICCSIDYPNVYYFSKVQDRETSLFKEWVVLLIEPSYLWHPETCFCPCNAAKHQGRHIKKGLDGFLSLYASESPGIPQYKRSAEHLSSTPTDVQAEVLLKDPIPLDSIIGIAVQSEEQALRETFRFELQGITLEKPIHIVEKLFDKESLSQLIRRGERPKGKLYRKRIS